MQTRLHQNNRDRFSLGLLGAVMLQVPVDPRANAAGSLRLFNDFLTRFHRRRALLARRLREEILGRLSVLSMNRATTCLSERGASLMYSMASVCSSGVSFGGLPLRGLSWRLAGPSCSHCLIHVETVSRSTGEILVISLIVIP